MSGGTVTLEAHKVMSPSIAGLDEALHCSSSGCGEEWLVYQRVDKLGLLFILPLGTVQFVYRIF